MQSLAHFLEESQSMVRLCSWQVIPLSTTLIVCHLRFATIQHGSASPPDNSALAVSVPGLMGKNTIGYQVRLEDGTSADSAVHCPFLGAGHCQSALVIWVGKDLRYRKWLGTSTSFTGLESNPTSRVLRYDRVSSTHVSLNRGRRASNKRK